MTPGMPDAAWSAGEALAPRYGRSALSDLLPSLLAALGLRGFPNRLSVEPMTGLCVAVIDGLGWEQIREHGEAAPFLSSAAREHGSPLTAGFPSTTATSLASLATGMAPGEHGLVGYTFALPGWDRPMNALQWELYGTGPTVPLVDEVVPERIQPHPTLLQRAEEAGLEIVVVGPPEHATSPLTRAILRGGRYVGAHSLQDLVEVVSGAIARETRAAVYAYHPFLDTVGHLRGVGSSEWLSYLGQVDAAVAEVAARLRPGMGLVVTGDHGMVNLAEDQRMDVADHPELLAGVRLLAGEPRARHVHARRGAQRDVLAIWNDLVGDRMWVRSREEAVAAGWFGPRVEEPVRSRIGDVVAAARGAIGIFQREVDPLQYQLTGQHGSLTDPEQLVPFILVRG